MFKKSIITGIGILVLLMLAGNAGATIPFQGINPAIDCSECHNGNGVDRNSNGDFFNATHRFNGVILPNSEASCTTCHVKIISPSDFSLTSTGQSYNKTHRYNDTTLASTRLDSPGCANCHVDVIHGNFTRITGTPTYLTSTTCVDCHKAKYDNWTNTLHRVMLTEKSKAQAMGLPTPPVGWDNISYVVVTKFAFAYINTTGYFLAQNDTYNTETQEFENGHAGAAYGTCGRCHTTGWDNSTKLLPGFGGTFAEPGIACERCHGKAGNGHQVVVNYSGNLCTECHTGGNHGTGWEKSEHAPPPFENGTSCMFCHSSFDQYKNQNVTIANATGVSCGVCHNIHDMTDSKYADTFSNGNFVADTWANVSDSKLSFFNATASIAAGTDIFDTLTSPALLYPGTDSSRKDSSYGTAPINVTGPVSEVLCSKCHYRHGIAHTAGVNLTHGDPNKPATCTDCHMGGSNATVGKDMMKNHAMDALIPTSCIGCHKSGPAIIKEWNASVHNVKEVGTAGWPNHFYSYSNKSLPNYGLPQPEPNTCLKCKSPINWNPSNTDNVTKINLTDFHGVSCLVCHDIHDMGDWLNKTKAAFGVSKPYGWYDKDAIVAATDANGKPTRYKASYVMMANTTALCGNCHTNIREGNTGPGWYANATGVYSTNPIGPHGFPAADVFAGSWKQTGFLNFECVDCHFVKVTRDANGTSLPADKRVVGHTFEINATLLQNGNGTKPCSTCHITGSILGNVSTTIAVIQANTHAKWNATNATVMSALNTIKANSSEKNLSRAKIAIAYWNLRLVSSEESWGVHNPTKVNGLLDDAARLANEANDSLGQKAAVVSTVQLKAGWNLVSLNGTPSVTTTASVMSSVASNITVVWGYNASATQPWEIYDPSMTASLNTLKNILPGKGYWIYAKTDVVWTA